MVTGVRMALVRPAVQNHPGRNVEITNVHAESYPSASHLAVALPQALRELGFDVVEAAKEEDAQALSPDYLLDLERPQVAAFHPSSGDWVTIVGSSYDVRVRYQARLRGKDLRPLGRVTGYGQDTRRFFFMEPLFKAAIVGAFVSAGTLLASGFMLFLVFQFGMLTNLAAGGEPFGVCAPESGSALINGAPDLGSVGTAEENCARLVNYGMYSAFLAGVSVSTALAGALAGALGENVFDVGLALGHLSVVDPAWKGLVQRAHDGAARDLAMQVVEQVTAQASLPAPPPALTPPANAPDVAVPSAPSPEPAVLEPRPPDRITPEPSTPGAETLEVP
jgi:hypothetical protein